MGAGFNDNEDDKPVENGVEGEGTPEAIADTPADDAEASEDGARLDLKDTDERLPWLESEDDEEEETTGSAGKAVGVVLGAVGALVLIVGGIWWANHGSGEEQVAAGGVIEAPETPYKEAPKDPGGKTFAGTGDQSFKVSEGQNPPARLGQAPVPASGKPATPTASPSAAASTPAAPVSGVGVQIAAYSNQDQAKAGWERLSGQYEALKGVPHRIQEGRADIGTVYRLQAVAPDAAGAQALCSRLKSAGLACQVKN